MSPARWDRLPPKAKVANEKKPRRSPAKGKWRCRVVGCGAVIEGSPQSLDRHLDGHGGGRADCIIEFKA
jgi:hypothetical protein